MTPDELKEYRSRLGLTQAELAVRLGVSANTVARWEWGGSQTVPVLLDRAMRDVEAEIAEQPKKRGRPPKRRRRPAAAPGETEDV